MARTFTIITPSFNSGGTIGDTVRSVMAQEGVDVQMLVVDGGSTDGTLALLETRADHRLRVIQGPDAGLYHAMNKGLGQATGEVVGILNADDYFTDANVLSEVAAVLEATGADAVYADIHYVCAHAANRVTRRWVSGAYRPRKFLFGWMPPHPAFFVRRDQYDRLGGFDERLRTSADYELMLRFLYKHRIKAAYLPRVVVHMRAGGQSNATWANRWRANREDRMAWTINGLRPLGLLTTALKPIRKIPQFVVFNRKAMRPTFVGTPAAVGRCTG